MVFQATATERIQTDVREMLHIAYCEKFVSSINRSNLFYEVRKPKVLTMRHRYFILITIYGFVVPICGLSRTSFIAICTSDSSEADKCKRSYRGYGRVYQARIYKQRIGHCVLLLSS
jgi:hypothetical protein